MEHLVVGNEFPETLIIAARDSFAQLPLEASPSGALAYRGTIPDAHQFTEYGVYAVTEQATLIARTSVGHHWTFSKVETPEGAILWDISCTHSEDGSSESSCYIQTRMQSALALDRVAWEVQCRTCWQSYRPDLAPHECPSVAR